METIATFNTENVAPEEVRDFGHRRAVRAVVFDTDNNIALLHSATKNSYTLPGGGVDTGESFEEGMVRECREEIRCNIALITPLGRTIEYRKQDKLLNETYGYIGDVIGDKGTPLFIHNKNNDEKNIVVRWVTLTEAVALMKKIPRQKNLYAQYGIERDVVFLKKAQEILPR